MERHERKLAPHQERLWHRRQEFASETTVSTWTRYRRPLSEAAGEWPMCAESRNRVVARSLRGRAREGESDGRVRDLSGQTRRVPIPLPCEHGREIVATSTAYPTKAEAKTALASVFGNVDDSTHDQGWRRRQRRNRWGWTLGGKEAGPTRR